MGSTTLLNCPRCGQRHNNLRTVRFSKHGALRLGHTSIITAGSSQEGIWDYWASCPMTGHPILISSTWIERLMDKYADQMVEEIDAEILGDLLDRLNTDEWGRDFRHMGGYW